MTEQLLYSARQCAEALGVSVNTFNRMFREGRIPECIQHPATFGLSRDRRYSRVLLERWAAGDLLDDVTFEPLNLTSTPAPPAAGRPADPSPLVGPPRAAAPVLPDGEQRPVSPHEAA